MNNVFTNTEQRCLASPDIWDRMVSLFPHVQKLEEAGEENQKGPSTLAVLSIPYIEENFSDSKAFTKRFSNPHMCFLFLTQESAAPRKSKKNITENLISELRKALGNKWIPSLILPFSLPREYIISAAQNLLQQSENGKKRPDTEYQFDISDYDTGRVLNISKALATEKNFEVLLTLILEQARRIVCADAGSIYVVEEENPNNLRFKRSTMLINSSEFVLPINSKSIAGHVALTGKTVTIDNVYNLPKDVPFSFNSELDKKYNYHTKSMLVLPMINQVGEVMGVLQLINRKNSFEEKITVGSMNGGKNILPFRRRDYWLTTSIANQSAIALYNQKLLRDQRKLLESFIELIGTAIDSKSEYTGGHCRRVPVLTELLTKAACECQEGALKDFQLSEDEWYELRIAAGLHDCGKIVTPVHIMDKATKLETIADRIENVKLRFDILRRNAKMEYMKHLLVNKNSSQESQTSLGSRISKIDEMEAFIEKMNIGREFVNPEELEKILLIGREMYNKNGKTLSLLTEQEIENLTVIRGTLTQEERITINAHMVETVKMLESLPFPKGLHRVPEYACGHHEKMDGTGYPRGIYGGDMSIPARIMAIADVFEALTAEDRPYKKSKSLSEAMNIMGKMKENNHFDPKLFDLFVKSKIYCTYAARYMPQELIDHVDEDSLLKIQPKKFTLPPKEERMKRWNGFLPVYQKMDRHSKKELEV